jgi:type I restriction enzyme S subunit
MIFTLVPLRHVANVRVSNVDKKSVEDEPVVKLCNYTDVYYLDKITGDLELSTATASLGQIQAFTLRAEDVLITKDSETPEDIGVPAFVPLNLDGVLCGYHLALLRPFDIDGRFLYFVMSSEWGRTHLAAAANGVTRFGLRLDEIKSLPVPHPPLVIQRQIVDHLDKETQRLDDLIVKKRRMIELLEESLVSWELDLVSKSSSRTTPLRWRLRVGSGDGIDADEVNEGPGTPVIGGNGVMGYTDLTSRVNEESIAVGRVGALCGNVHKVDPPAWITDNALWLRSFDAIDRDFLVLALRVADLNSKADKTAQPLITGETVKSLRILWPLLDVQQRVAAVAEKHRNRFKELTQHLRDQILLLQEHRQALITAAVTGQLEIPEVAA